MKWSGLYEVFTEEVNPAVRMQVLRRLASDKPIWHDGWEDKNGGPCLFLAASRAAGNRLVASGRSSRRTREEWVAVRLGVTAKTVHAGIELWDAGSNKERAAFLDRIRAYLAVKKMTRQAITAMKTYLRTRVKKKRQPVMV